MKYKTLRLPRILKLKILSSFVLLLFAATPFPALASTDLPASEETIEEIYADLEIFSQALVIIEDHYAEPTEPKDLIRGALKGMLHSLDPHSYYLVPKEFDELKVDTQGEFGGLGIEISVREGVLTVITALDDTPAYRAGLKPLDKIVSINDESTQGIGLDDAVEILRGKPGTEVKLSILRDGQKRLLEVGLIREIIEVESIKSLMFADTSTGYIRISEFQEKTPKEFTKSLKTLEKQKMTGLIIDLRNNSGGLLPEAVQVAEEFVPKGKVVVSTHSRNEEQNMTHYSKGKSKPKLYPILVLVNRGTASSSEILAGALQDHGLAKVLGTQTFGKASIQTVIPIKDGSAIRLTTSRYLTPNERMIHGQGIEPDVIVEANKDAETDEDDEPELPLMQRLMQEDEQAMKAIEMLTAKS